MNSIFSMLRNKSFRTQLIYGSVSVLTILIITFTYIVTKKQSDFLYEEGTKQAENRSKALAVSSKIWIMSNDYAGLEETISSFSFYDDLTFAAIIDLDGKIIGHTDKKLVGKFIADKKRIEYLNKLRKPIVVQNEEDKILFHTTNKYIDIMRAIDHGNQHLGLVHIRMDQSTRQKNIDSIILEGILFTLVSMFISILVAFLLANSLTKQLSGLVITMKNIIDGDKNAKADENGAKEISELSHEFNSLIRSLASSEKLNQKLSLAVEQSPNSIVITDLEGNIEYVNTMFTKITGYTKDEVLGQNPSILKSDETPQATYEEMWAHLSRGDIWNGELTNRRKDQSIYIESAIISPVKQADGKTTNYVAIKEDITEKKKVAAKIDYLAHFDQLTGLPNRVLLNDRVTYQLDMAQRNNEPLAVMFLDLDHFKNINDFLGHTIGDYVLVEIAKRITKTIRKVDTVSRLGGDEFIMLFPNTDSNAAMHIATKLIEEISKPSTFEHNELTITPSIGIAIYPDDGKDFETLLKNADTAMYKVKNDRRNGFHFFTQEMQLNLARKLQLENALRHALKRNELQLYYQPQISITDGRIIGAEALLRWNHPELGMVSPAEFIPIAESSGQIIEIGKWVLRTAIQQTKEWMDDGFDPMIIAVNISAIQFREETLLQLITDILEEMQLPSEYLELELTEAVTMHDPESVINVMNKFHQQGIRMSIDDFGTGYSSLSYLKQFKVYKLKIDQSFIHDISNDPDDRAIVSAIIDMAHNLGLVTIAEGVETAEQLAFLRLHGCNEVQGYYFSKPLPSVEFEQFLKNSIKGSNNIE